MHYHSNHCRCFKSNWDNKNFDARHMVSFDKYIGYDIDKINPEWESLVYTKRMVKLEEYKLLSEIATDKNNKIMYGMDKEIIKEMSMRDCPHLLPEVIEWLMKEISQSTDINMAHQPQGWCMGNDEYRQSECSNITLWFLRRRDAMKFIKRWSIHKKPTTYCDYFKDDRRKLVNGTLIHYDS